MEVVLGQNELPMGIKNLASLTLFFSGTLLLLLTACSKDDGETSEMVVNDPTVTGTVLSMGTFTGSGSYRVSGSAKLLDQAGKKVLRLENLSSSNGPDLKVYLASDAAASRFIDLGRLKSISGNQNYDITGNPDLSQYPFALIWCKQFGALFGSAPLK
jgi:hypothetical protein